MAGQKSNVIEYVFQGDIIDLEKATNRAKKLLASTVTELEELQGGSLTETQKAEVAHLRALTERMEDAKRAGTSLTKEQKKQALVAGKYVLSETLKMSKQAQAAQEKANKKEAQATAESLSTAGIEAANQRATYLEKYTKKLSHALSAPAQTEILGAVNDYRAAMNDSTLSDEERAEAVQQLMRVYRQYSATLQALRRSEEQSRGGIQSFNDFIVEMQRQIKVSLKSFTFWIQIIRLLLRTLKGFLQLLDQLRRNGQLNDPNLAGWKEIAETFRDLSRQMSIFMTNVGGLLAKVLAPIAKALTFILMLINAVLGALSGVAAIAENTESRSGGLMSIDEINTQQESEEDQLKKLTRGWDDLQKHMQPIIELFKLIGQLLDIILSLLSPVLEFIYNIFDALGPLFTSLTESLQPLFTIFDGLVEAFNGVLKPFLDAVVDVVQVIVAVLTGDFDSLGEHLISLFKNVGKMFANSFIVGINFLIDVLNLFIAGFGRSLELLWNPIASLIGVFGGPDLSLDTSSWRIPRVPYMEHGAVVKRPTLSMIGEGRYPEAVVPLGDSPQFASMKEDIAAQVVSRMDNRPLGGTNNRSIILNLNGRELARALLPDLQFVQPQTGVKLR